MLGPLVANTADLFRVYVMVSVYSVMLESACHLLAGSDSHYPGEPLVCSDVYRQL